MKRRICYAIATLCLGLSLVLSTNALQMPTGDPTEEPVKMRVTCYCDEGKTASGKQTRYGIMAGKSEWQGCVACVYAVNDDGSIGEFIDFFEILDTGAGIDTDGDGKGDSIKNGYSVDVFQPTGTAVAEWQARYGDYLYIYIVRGEG